jgi:hypothetical protein
MVAPKKGPHMKNLKRFHEAINGMTREQELELCRLLVPRMTGYVSQTAFEQILIHSLSELSRFTTYREAVNSGNQGEN